MFTSPRNHLQEARALLRLAGPLIVNNLSIAGMQFADAVMAGRLGAEALAAGGRARRLIDRTRPWRAWDSGPGGVLEIEEQSVEVRRSPHAARHHGGAGDEALHVAQEGP